jgi:hypothetical protein
MFFVAVEVADVTTQKKSQAYANPGEARTVSVNDS